ncbi:MAG: hypothetical protein HGA85_04185 [Nanoarchaeota archaeon]|nr:hypothetical protein [Nanoarchaeota archaeon]
MLQAIIDKRAAVLIAAVFIFCLAENLIILHYDKTPFSYDIADSYYVGQNFYKHIINLRLGDFFADYLFNYNKDYPPIFLFQPFVFYLLMGVSEDAAALSNSIPLFILIVSAYALAFKLYGRKAAVFAAVSIPLLPGFLAFSRVFLPDFAVAAYLTAYASFLVDSNGFRKNRMKLGLLIAVGMLTKHTFALYCGLLTLSYLIFGIRKPDIRGALVSGAVGSLVSAIWYIPHHDLVARVVQVNGAFYKISDGFIGSFITGAASLASILVTRSLFFIYAIPLYLLALEHISDRRRWISLFVLAASAFFSVAAIVYVDPRVFVPLAPFLLVIAGFYMSKLLRLEWLPLMIFVVIGVIVKVGLVSGVSSLPLTNTVYLGGLLYPISGYERLDALKADIMAIPGNRGTILILQDSAVASSLSYSLSRKYRIYNPFLFAIDMNMSDLAPYMHSIDEVGICNFTAVLYTDKPLRQMQEKSLQAARGPQISEAYYAQAEFLNCSNYILSESYTFPYESDTTSVLSLYINQVNARIS